VTAPAAGAIGAAVDVGSNSVHLLVAATSGDRLVPLADESAFLGLGDGVSATGVLGPELRSALVATLGAYAGRARGLGATRIALVGTAAMRRAADAAAAVRTVERELGLALHVLDPSEEGLLMFLGATLDRAALDRVALANGGVAVVDVGGGSTEIVVAAVDRAPAAVGVPIGSASLTAAHVTTDPPGRTALEAVTASARAAFDLAPEVRQAHIVAVGGTSDNVLKLVPGGAERRAVTAAELDEALAILAAEPAAALAGRYRLKPARAHLLPAGAAILRALLERYGAQELSVSPTGLREGAILAALRGGPAWRDALPSLARSWLR
jgi:exopolyphosphatase/pppGpp-phosphohydrolase